MHLVQALTLSPEGNLTHCKLGFCFLLIVGLYFPRSFTLRQAKIYFFPQIEHCLAICFDSIRIFYFFQDMIY